MSLPSVNFLHLTFSWDIAWTNFFPLPTHPTTHLPEHLPTHPDTMDENNTLTALTGCGVKTYKIANLISKLNFYKLIPYPMDNCFTGRRNRSRQTTEKVILYKIPAGPVTECTFARCRLVHTSCLVRMTSSRLFSLSKPIRPLVSW